HCSRLEHPARQHRRRIKQHTHTPPHPLRREPDASRNVRDHVPRVRPDHDPFSCREQLLDPLPQCLPPPPPPPPRAFFNHPPPAPPDLPDRPRPPRLAFRSRRSQPFAHHAPPAHHKNTILPRTLRARNSLSLRHPPVHTRHATSLGPPRLHRPVPARAAPIPRSHVG